MRAFELKNGTSQVRVELLPPRPSDRGIWRMAATANGRGVKGRTTIPAGIQVEEVPASVGRHGRTVIDARFARIVIIQKWRPQRREVGAAVPADG